MISIAASQSLIDMHRHRIISPWVEEALVSFQAEGRKCRHQLIQINPAGGWVARREVPGAGLQDWIPGPDCKTRRSG
jgi:hypothetical protein